MRELVIVGAGVSGLSAAQRLSHLNPLILEKSRGLGGRLHSRRYPQGQADIGAQYFTARDPRFVAEVLRWQQHDLVALWQGRIASWHQGSISWSGKETRYVGQERMQDFCRLMASGLEVAFGQQVQQCHWLAQQQCWQIACQDGSSLLSKRLLLSVPRDQVPPLLAEDDRLALPAPMLPCHSFVLTLDRPSPVAFEGLFVNGSPIAWLARDNSKPQRPDQECWVVHLTPTASQEHLLTDAERLWSLLRVWLTDLNLGIDWQQAQARDLHLWRYARPGDTHQNGVLPHPERPLWLCGDWLANGRVEGAWLSGLQAATAIMDHSNG